jgi:hypothetical protein
VADQVVVVLYDGTNFLLLSQSAVAPTPALHATTHAAAGSDPVNHNTLANLQGGGSGDFQHLTSAQVAALHQAVTVMGPPLTLVGQAITFNFDGSDFQLSGNNLQVKDSGISHGAISGLGNDDHTQYLLLAGRGSGQLFYGGTGSGENLTLRSTNNVTKGKIIFGVNNVYDEANDFFGIGNTSPDIKCDVYSGNVRIMGKDGYDTAGDKAILFLGNKGSGDAGYAGILAQNSYGVKICVYKSDGNGALGTNSLDALNIAEVTGFTGVGQTTPQEMLDVNGAIRIGNSANTNNGTIRWTGTDFEGRKGGAWVSMTGGGSSPGGANTNIQFNNSGSFGGDSQFVWDNTNKRLGVGAAPISLAYFYSALTGTNLGGKVCIQSSASDYGQLQIGSGTDEAAAQFIGKVSSFGDPTSSDGNTHVWGIGCGGWGIGGENFHIGNKSYNNPIVAITSEGYVGIGKGTTMPVHRLSVKHNSTSVPVAKFTAGGVSTWIGTCNGFDNPWIAFGDSGGETECNNPSDSNYGFAMSTVTGGDLGFARQHGSHTWYEFLRVHRANGFINIGGCAEPGARVEISGSESEKVRISGGSGQNGMTWCAAGGGKAWYAYSYNAGFGIYNNTDGNQPFTILNSGIIGFGCNPTAERLELSGAIKIGDASGTADGTIKYANNVFSFRQNGSWVNFLTSQNWSSDGSGYIKPGSGESVNIYSDTSSRAQLSLFDSRSYAQYVGPAMEFWFHRDTSATYRHGARISSEKLTGDDTSMTAELVLYTGYNDAFVEAVRLRRDGSTITWTNSTSYENLWARNMVIADDSSARTHLTLRDTLTGYAQGNGAHLSFTAYYSSGNSGETARIESYKDNGADGNQNFDLLFHTRDNSGYALKERMRLMYDGSIRLSNGDQTVLTNMSDSSSQSGYSISQTEESSIRYLKFTINNPGSGGTPDHGYYFACRYGGTDSYFLKMYTTSTHYAMFNSLVGINVSSIDTDYAFQIGNNSTYKAKAYALDTYSDKRIKTDIQDLDYGLNTILALKPKRYSQHDSELYTDSEISNMEGSGKKTKKRIGNRHKLLDSMKNTIGLISQDVIDVIPEAVSKPDDENSELWGMDYTKIIPVLVKAIQELSEEVTALKKQIKTK